MAEEALVAQRLHEHLVEGWGFVLVSDRNLWPDCAGGWMPSLEFWSERFEDLGRYEFTQYWDSLSSHDQRNALREAHQDYVDREGL